MKDLSDYQFIKRVRVKLKYLGILAFLVSGAAFSASYSEVSIVKGVSIGENFVRVKLQNMKSLENCPHQSWYVLDTTADSSKLLYSGILSANAAKTKLSLQITDSHSVGSKTYPKITHVYLCDTAFCS
ncbi:hypothetical protein MED121_04388 [Marinomonas sp. MED121]|uniref:hypothetical protein n=1 Tax=Marinomonas sp. MED121 TaxID=314277 RepID=UPI00006901FF|nr:hypothetical protein [Marinomonas sp. MED121]EAQ64327.1 hypothetical protein MED121_04388 [Marinomonas sp. MED121]